MDHPDHLPRLDDSAYRDTAWVHWTKSCVRMAGRNHAPAGARTSFAYNVVSSSALRRVLPDAGSRSFPVDGLWEGSDQRLASRFFRKHWNVELASRGTRLQPQAYDHVLRENERRPDAFEDTVIYIFKNTERAGLVSDWREWPYAGSILPGYPDLAAAGFGGFWPMFWKIHNRERTRFGS